jgi:hypothetical protein
MVNHWLYILSSKKLGCLVTLAEATGPMKAFTNPLTTVRKIQIIPNAVE